MKNKQKHNQNNDFTVKVQFVFIYFTKFQTGENDKKIDRNQEKGKLNS